MTNLCVFINRDVRLAPNRTNPGLFQIRAKMFWNRIWKSSGLVPFVSNLTPLWVQIGHPERGGLCISLSKFWRLETWLLHWELVLSLRQVTGRSPPDPPENCHLTVKNCQKLDIFSKKNCQNFSFFSKIGNGNFFFF